MRSLEIVPYDAGWSHAFLAEGERIAGVLGARAGRIEHHVDVVQASGDVERRTSAFREYRRDHSDITHEYAALERRLAPHCNATDAAARQAYADAKTGFVTRVVDVALAAGYPRDV